MKQLFFFLVSQLILLTTWSQETPKIPVVDKSPMDMSYFPENYPLQKFQGKVTGNPTIRVIYGRPQKDGRIIFGDLIKYNEVWRVGANEATEIEFFKTAKIDGKLVPKGRYTLYCIPNKDTDSWGAFKYDSKKDLFRVKVPVKKVDVEVEALSIYFEKTTTGTKLNVAWDNALGVLPITFN
jgi:hypothetical protein